MVASKNFSRAIDFRYYRHQIRKRLWLVTLIVLISLGVGAFQVLSIQPLYQSGARLLINDNRALSSVVPFKDPLQAGRGRGGALNTQVKVLRSPALATKVIEALNLESHPEFVAQKDPFKENVNTLIRTAAERLSGVLAYVQQEVFAAYAASEDVEDSTLNAWTDRLQGWLQVLQDEGRETEKDREMAGTDRGLAEPVVAGTSNPEQLAPPVDGEMPMPTVKPPSAAFTARFQSRLVIRPDFAADIITVGYRAHDANLAADVANTLADLYIGFSRETRFGAAQDAVNWLRARAAETQKQVEDSERELENYKKEHDVYSVEERIAGLTMQLTTLNTKIAEAETERVGFETLHRKLEEAMDSPQIYALLPVLGENERIRELKKANDQLETQLNQLRKRYGPGHPQVAKRRAERRQQQQELDDELEQAIEASEARYELVKSREASMRAQFDKLKDEVRGLNEIAIRYRSLERDAESNRR
ncbi:GumC family protein, partial [Candidatus Entotheonella palauensis]|uniref:GumC family protein n=1 Tax=Candidatus Entotheonella palauensis TaxID=93172 RepID=UPI0011783DBB